MLYVYFFLWKMSLPEMGSIHMKITDMESLQNETYLIIYQLNVQ